MQPVINHCARILHRADQGRKARSIVVRVQDAQIQSGRLVARVMGSQPYDVVIGPQSWSCTCPDAYMPNRPCKHTIAVASHGAAQFSQPESWVKVPQDTVAVARKLFASLRDSAIASGASSDAVGFKRVCDRIVDPSKTPEAWLAAASLLAHVSVDTDATALVVYYTVTGPVTAVDAVVADIMWQYPEEAFATHEDSRTDFPDGLAAVVVFRVGDDVLN